MTAPSAMAPARKRKRKTRTRRVSARPSLIVSDLPPSHVDLRPEAFCLVCPDCHTWCPITGRESNAPKVVPHDTAPAGTPGRRRCGLGSNRRVQVDLTVGEWRQRLAKWQARQQAAARHADQVWQTSRRRGNTDLPTRARPRTRTAPSVPQAQADTQARTRGELTVHMHNCPSCKGGRLCSAGRRLRDHMIRLSARHTGVLRTALASS